MPLLPLISEYEAIRPGKGIYFDCFASFALFVGNAYNSWGAPALILKLGAAVCWDSESQSTFSGVSFGLCPDRIFTESASLARIEI